VTKVTASPAHVPWRDTQAWLRELRATSPQWAATLARELAPGGALIDMGYVSHRPELEDRRQYHEHGSGRYLRDRDGRCWMCGKKEEPTGPERSGQLSLENRQLTLEADQP
jgi:hypothetical protein